MIGPVTVCALLGVGWGCGVANGDIGGTNDEPAGVHFLRVPTVLEVAQLGPSVNKAAITDVETLDFTQDGLGDLAVAWYADDPATGARSRFLTLFAGNGTTQFARAFDIDLYRPDTAIGSFDNSVFLNGTGDVVVGDYDGDGDPDLAVLPYGSSELWFIENLDGGSYRGGGSYRAYYKYMFGEFSGGFMTPPEGVSADFDGDGRKELAYLVNVTPNALSGPIQFWRTDGAIADMQLVDWEGFDGSVGTTWMLGLAVGDFTMDGRPDLAFTAEEQTSLSPLLVTWHSLDTTAQEFQVSLQYLPVQPSDVVAVKRTPGCRDVAISDAVQGDRVDLWSNSCDGAVSFSLDGTIDSLSGTSPGRGPVVKAADVNGDGTIDLVCRQRGGSAEDDSKLELLVRGVGVGPEYYLAPGVFDTAGLEDDTSNQLLRPRNLAVADMFGSPLPEVAAAFNPPITIGTEKTLEVRVWSNGCLGDVTGDGRTDLGDIAAILYWMPIDPSDIPDIMLYDLNRNGDVDLTDLTIVLGDYGCAAP